MATLGSTTTSIQRAYRMQAARLVSDGHEARADRAMREGQTDSLLDVLQGISDLLGTGPASGRRHLSGSTSGRVIPVVATATAGTLIHTAVAGSTSFDELYLWASNVTAGAATLTVEWGGVLDPGDHIVKGLVINPNSAPTCIVHGRTLNGGLAVRAFSGTASAINISGFVIRIST